MPKFFSFLTITAMALGTIAAVNRSPAQTGPQAEFIPVSVLADHHADYGVDENLLAIPAISLEIVADKLRDEGNVKASLPVILFTTDDGNEQGTGTNEPEQEQQPEEQTPSTEEEQEKNNNGNGQEKDKGNKGNGQEKDKDKGKDKDKDKDKDEGKGKGKDKNKGNK